MKLTDFVIYNGEKYRLTDKIFGINNRGFRYGDGFFESIISYYEEVPFFGHHYQRMRNAGRDFGMKFPDFFNASYFLNEIDRLRKSNKFFGKVYTRLAIFREGEGKYFPSKDVKVSYFMEQKFLGQSKFDLGEGLVLDKFVDYKKPVNRWSAYKKISADLFVLASIYANKKGVDDVLIINEKGFVIETTNSNIFCLNKDNTVYTPALSIGCVDGVMRKVVIDLIKRAGVKLVEVEDFSDEYINGADEFFVTNAVSGVRWVKAYKHKRFLKDLSSELVKQLNDIYFK